jgi:hypothetical protein
VIQNLPLFHRWPLGLFAQAGLPPGDGPQANLARTFYELNRLRSFDQWWHWLLLGLACALIVSLVTWMYRRDSVDLPRGKRWLLLLLRVTAFVGLLIFLLDLQKRTEQRIVKNSRCILLVDTSQSMSLVDQRGEYDGAASGDAEASGNVTPGSRDAGSRRIDQIVQQLANGPLVAELRQKHDVVVYRFDAEEAPAQVAVFSKQRQAVDPVAAAVAVDRQRAGALEEARRLWTIAAGLLGFAGLALAVHFLGAALLRGGEGESWGLLVAMLALITAMVVAAVTNLRHPALTPPIAFGEPAAALAAIERSEAARRSGDLVSPARDALPDQADDRFATPDWPAVLAAKGRETRLGDALQTIVSQENGGPIAGIALITDGNNNRGLDPTVAMQAAKQASIPVFPVGMGADQRPTSLRVVDLECPARVYPGDQFSLTGYVQAYGLEGRTVKGELVSRGEGAEVTDLVEEEVNVKLPEDGRIAAVPLKVTPDEPGTRIYTFRIAASIGDQDKRDDQASAKVQIVDRNTLVLLIAGGPMREYRFVRNLLFRDKRTTVHVLLQSGGEGMAQEAHQILQDLPTDAAELFEYDCIVAFDPDWNKFDRDQLELIERWIAEKAGGFVGIAGPVFTPSWAENRRAGPQAEILKQIYPVTFYSLNTGQAQLGRFGSTTPWPLQLTDDGRQSPFLMLREEESEPDVWKEFAGIYGYYAVKDPKPGATVLARFSDPQTAIDGELPIYIASQFYGAGRVVFLGSGEMWRLRGIDNLFFERFYTKLIRFVAQGRLLRDSNRGILLVDKERALLGDTVTVRASVVDEQFRPLKSPSLEASLVLPNQTRRTLTLRQSSSDREGIFVGQFLANQEGEFRVELALSSSSEPVVLQRDVRVRLPDLEIERPQRNDALLSEIAQLTQGYYFIGINAAVRGAADAPSLAARLPNMDRETFLPGTPDRAFERRLMSWLLALICGALSLEWLIRRLNKLA